MDLLIAFFLGQFVALSIVSFLYRFIARNKDDKPIEILPNILQNVPPQEKSKKKSNDEEERVNSFYN